MLFSAPSGWDDVLTTNHMYGRCNDYGENTAKIFFKCANHKAEGDDLSIPLYQIHVNNIKVECLTCLEIQVQANEQ